MGFAGGENACYSAPSCPLTATYSPGAANGSIGAACYLYFISFSGMKRFMRLKLCLFLSGYLCIAVCSGSALRDSCKNIIERGNSYLWRFKVNEALMSYHRGLQIAHDMDDDFLYSHALMGIGQALWYNGRLREAVDTIKLSVKGFRRSGHKGDMGSALRILSNIYDDQGDYENAFKTVTEALEIYGNKRGDHNIGLSLVQMGELYKSMGDYETAMEYFRRAEALELFEDEYPYRELHHRMGELYALQDKITEARLEYRKALAGNPRSKIVRVKLGDLYLKERNFDTAFLYYDSLYKEAQAPVDVNIIIASSLGLAKIYLQKQDYAQAAAMAEVSLTHSSSRGARHNKRDAYRVLSAVYEASGNAALALLYHKQYEALKDSVVSENLRRQLFTFRQAMDAEKLKTQRNQLITGIVVLFILAALAFFIISLRHKNERLRLKQRAAELEMQALRAQMNPHFIFNSLSAINHFILNNEGDTASEYLTRFARLIRMVLVNAGKTIISLEEELAMLRLYLNMEQLRFKEAFDYFIYFDEGLHASMINVPSFILQPFCENAIWHGLLHKEGKGQLTIHFSMREEVLICVIRDNGIGRRKAAELKAFTIEKGASFGNRLSAERLELFNGDKAGASFVMEDITDGKGEVTGTQVTLKITNKQGHD